MDNPGFSGASWQTLGRPEVGGPTMVCQEETPEPWIVGLVDKSSTSNPPWDPGTSVHDGGAQWKHLKSFGDFTVVYTRVDPGSPIISFLDSSF